MRYYSRKFVCDDQTEMSRLVEEFLSEKPKKRAFGNFRIKEDGIYYTAEVQERSYSEETILKTDVVAKRIKREGQPDLLLGNSSILPLIGRTVSYGNASDNREETLIQKLLARRIPMIPFVVFEQAQLDLNAIRIIEQSAPDTLTRKRENPQYDNYGPNKREPKFIEETVHFTGSSLFEVQGRYFLFDMDRREIHHKIFNPFLAEIPKPVKSINEAYQALKPKAVIDAQKKGLEVLRQGEWFFIPAAKPKLPKLSDRQKFQVALSVMSDWELDRGVLAANYDKDILKAQREAGLKLADKLAKPMVLKAGDNRPNTASMGVKQGKTAVVSGVVKHSGREHADLELPGWYIAIPNTATRSFTITGDID